MRKSKAGSVYPKSSMPRAKVTKGSLVPAERKPIAPRIA